MKFDPSLPIYKSLRHRLREAFNEAPNLLAMASTVALSAALISPLPLIIGLVAEAAYLLFVPDSKWYERRLQSRFDGEVVARRNELKKQTFPIIRDQIRHEFVRLEQVRGQIEGQSRGEEPWFREALRKLDFLMEKYLQFAQKEAHFATYLMSVYTEVYDQTEKSERRKMPKPIPPKAEDDNVISMVMSRRVEESYSEEGVIDLSPEWVEEVTGTISEFYERELANLDESIESESVPANRNLMEKRHQVLRRRQDFIARVSQIMSNLGLQMRLMSDTFGLINDEMRARSPEQVLSDIDDVVLQATSLTEAIDQITPMTEVVGNLS